MRFLQVKRRSRHASAMEVKNVTVYFAHERPAVRLRGLPDSQAVVKRMLLVNIARTDSTGNGIYERQDFHKNGPGPWKCGNLTHKDAWCEKRSPLGG
jgi:hypothetical protein